MAFLLWPAGAGIAALLGMGGNAAYNAATTTPGLTHLAFHPQDDVFAAGTSNGLIAVVDAKTGKEMTYTKLNAYPSGPGRTNCVTWTPDGRYIFSGGCKDTLGRAADEGTTGGYALRQFAPRGPNSSCDILKLMGREVMEVDDLSFAQSTGILASLDIRRRSVQLWSRCQKHRGEHQVWFKAKELSALQQALADISDHEPLALGWGETVSKGLQLAVACRSGTLLVLDVNGAVLTRVENALQCETGTCKWSPCGCWVACGLKDGSVLLYDTSTWEPFTLENLHNGQPVTGISWSNSPPHLLASVGGDEVVISAPYSARAARAGSATGLVRDLAAGHKRIFTHPHARSVSWGRRFLGTACSEGLVYVVPTDFEEELQSKVVPVYTRWLRGTLPPAVEMHVDDTISASDSSAEHAEDDSSTQAGARYVSVNIMSQLEQLKHLLEQLRTAERRMREVHLSTFTRTLPDEYQLTAPQSPTPSFDSPLSRLPRIPSNFDI